MTPQQYSDNVSLNGINFDTINNKLKKPAKYASWVTATTFLNMVTVGSHIMYMCIPQYILHEWLHDTHTSGALLQVSVKRRQHKPSYLYCSSDILVGNLSLSKQQNHKYENVGVVFMRAGWMQIVKEYI